MLSHVLLYVHANVCTCIYIELLSCYHGNKVLKNVSEFCNALLYLHGTFETTRAKQLFLVVHCACIECLYPLIALTNVGFICNACTIPHTYIHVMLVVCVQYYGSYRVLISSYSPH